MSGPHRYPDPDGTSDCLNGCGCYMGPFTSGGPKGVDPFGDCPKALPPPAKTTREEVLEGLRRVAASRDPLPHHRQAAEAAIAFLESQPPVEAAAPELADALEGLLINTETGSYCEWCRQHAPKDETGRLVGPVPHADGCPAVIAHAALAKAGREVGR